MIRGRMETTKSKREREERGGGDGEGELARVRENIKRIKKTVHTYARLRILK